MAATLITFQVTSEGDRQCFKTDGKYSSESSEHVDEALKNGKITHLVQSSPDQNGTITVTVAIEH